MKSHVGSMTPPFCRELLVVFLASGWVIACIPAVDLRPVLSCLVLSCLVSQGAGDSLPISPVLLVVEPGLVRRLCDWLDQLMIR
jgi:hypothetical protein